MNKAAASNRLHHDIHFTSASPSVNPEKRTHVNPRGNAKQCPLLADDIKIARTFWLKMIQRTLFASEYFSLVQGHALSKRSKFIALNPYLDNDDLIRVKGRL